MEINKIPVVYRCFAENNDFYYQYLYIREIYIYTRIWKIRIFLIVDLSHICHKVMTRYKNIYNNY